jgi:membrane protease YdiL (CAAX protease family)
MKGLEKLYNDWTRLKPVKFVIVTTILTIVFSMPITIVFQIIGLQYSDIGIPNYKYGIIGTLIIVTVVGPIIETFMGQALPIYLTQRFTKWKTFGLSVSISTVLFALAHLGYSLWYFFLMIPTGILLALTYIVFQNRKESSFLMTYAVHSLKNLIAITFTLKEILK